MDETFLDSVSRWLGYIALTWITYLIYLASGISIADCVEAIRNPKKTGTPQIQVIPATPNTPDKTFVSFELPPAPAAESNISKKKEKPVVRIPEIDEDEFVQGENTDHSTDISDTTLTSECVAAPETSAVAAAASATSALFSDAANINSATELCDPMCDPTTRFNVTRCSFSVEKLQTLPTIKILTPEDVCPPGTLISGLPESGKDDNGDSDPSPTNTYSQDRSESELSGNLTDHHSPQSSNPTTDVDNGTSPTGRRTGGDDLLVKMLCDIDEVDASCDLRKPRPSIDDPLVASDAVELFRLAHVPREHGARKHLNQHSSTNGQASRDLAPEKYVRFTLPDDDCSDDTRSDEDDFQESPDSDDEDSEGSPKTLRKTPSRQTPTSSPFHTTSPLFESLLKDLSDEALDESTAHIDTNSVLDALLFQNRRRRSLPTVQEPGGDYEMVYREKLERQSLGDSVLTEPSVTPQKFKASLREEDFADLLPPLSPDCGYDSFSEVVSSPDELDCYGSAQQLSVIVEEDPLEEEKSNTGLKKNTATNLIQNSNAVDAGLIGTMNGKREKADVKTSSLANRNHSLAPAEDFDNFTTVRL